MNDTIRMRLTAVIEYDAVIENYVNNENGGKVDAREISLIDIMNAGEIVYDAVNNGSVPIIYTLKAAEVEPDLEDILMKAREMAEDGVKKHDLIDWIFEQLLQGAHA